MIKLLERTIDALRAEEHEPWYINGSHKSNGSFPEETPRKVIAVEETWRRNYKEEKNVTVTIYVIEWNISCSSAKRTEKIKVPKEASEKVLKNRVEKAIAIYEEWT